jgi:hypothetical protein
VPSKEVFDSIQSNLCLSPVKAILLKLSPNYQPNNFFEIDLKSMNELGDMEVMYRGVKKVFEDALDDNYGRDYLKETMAILTKTIKINPKFLEELYAFEYDFNFVLVSTCHHIAHYAAKEGGEGITFLNLSLLQLYSEHREFAIGLNKSYDLSTNVKLEYTSTTFSDCFIVFVRDMVLLKEKKLEQLDLSLLGIMANM